jgi:hypothetical protein
VRNLVVILWICKVLEGPPTSMPEYLVPGYRRPRLQVLSCLLEVELNACFGQLQFQKSQLENGEADETSKGKMEEGGSNL